MTFDPFGDFESRGYLRNNEGIKDPAEVKRLEHEVFRDHVGGAIAALRTGKPLGYEDVLETHRRLFQTMYPWAGQDRTENAPDIAIVKGGRSDLFAYPDEIHRAAAHALTRGQKVEIMRERPGEVMGLLAYAHPFLEGNGRTIMVVHGELCWRAGLHIDWQAIPKKDYLEALTKELDQPGRHLDRFLAPHVRLEGLGREQEATILRSLPGLGPARETDRPLHESTAPQSTAKVETCCAAHFAPRPPPSSSREANQGETRPREKQSILLPANAVDRTLPLSEVSARVEADPHIAPYVAALESAAEVAFKEPAAVVASLTRQAIEMPGAEPAIRMQLYERPEVFGELRGGTTLLGREDAERQGARSAGGSVANAFSELADVARSIKAEILSDWSEYVQREQIAIPAPSEELQAVLGQGEMTATSIAEVARNTGLVNEINAFLEAAQQRFGWAGMAAIRGDRMAELRDRMSGIKEHDLERAARLTQDVAKLHDRVQAQHERQERKAEHDLKLTHRSAEIEP